MHPENVCEIAQEPPLKKFKALFDASHPDQNSAEDHESGISYGVDPCEPQSLTQSGTQTQLATTSEGHMDVEPTRLAAVAEEEEESATNWSRVRQTKRKLTGDGDEAASAIAERGPASKRLAVENINAVEPSNQIVEGDTIRSKLPSRVTSASKPGAAIGQPDTDTAFLKAVASTKKGKKAEDSFDREFNKLKISKPDVQRDEQEKAWAVLAEFDEERNVRGNFMVVLEMDIYSRGNERGCTGNTVATLEWQERPNFKKFKRVSRW